MKVDRHKLRFGPYATPCFRYGQRVLCEVRGEVVIVGLSTGRIPWPIAYAPGNANRMLVIYRGLAKAVRKEAAAAVCHYWWSVTAQTVSGWRGIMGVGPHTDGSRKLRAEHGKRNWQNVGPKFLAKAQDPERRAKIAKAKRGRPRPPEVVEKMRRAATDRIPSKAARSKMSEAQRKRKARPPWLNPAWSATEDDLLRKLPAGEVAKRTRRTLIAVYMRRRKRRLLDGELSPRKPRSV